MMTTPSCCLIHPTRFGLLFICFAPVLVQILYGADPQTTTDAVNYLRILGGCAIIPCMLGMTGAILRGNKDSKAVFRVGVTMNLIHLPLDYVFIFTFGLGVKGAALATVLANLFGLVFMWMSVKSSIFLKKTWSNDWMIHKLLFQQSLLNRRSGAPWKTVITHLFELNYTWWKLQKKIFADRFSWRRNAMLQKKLIEQSLSTMGTLIVAQISALYLNRTTLQYGTEIYAAGRIAKQIKELFDVAWITGFSNAVSPLVAECFGKRNYKEAIRYCNWAVGVVTVGSVIMWAIQSFTGKWIIGLFTDNAHVITTSYWMLSILVIMDGFWAIQACVFFSLRGVSFTKWQFTCSLIANLLIMMAIWVSNHNGWDYKTIYYIELVYWIMLCLFEVARFYSCKWIPARTPKHTELWIQTWRPTWSTAWTPAGLPMWSSIWFPQWNRQTVDDSQ
ncbi:polysaccharide biosynthesis C-terminal domain-containing protein [Shimazuella sp. AN120528]|uniref:MATE family efflux transporter n=1 Tax=Shimazuella soli TaxID=1892854 RepID=UPI001F0D7DAC|nr:MATE family efflux transporter [Shimazuella soli]MCH5585316.1 polysaccharide biosynthesis C-terminal domain-containing protein [Shimazuella soli]